RTHRCKEEAAVQEPTTATIGCDLGERQSVLSILWPDGRMERPKPIKTTAEAMRLFFTRPKAHVIMEVGTHHGLRSWDDYADPAYSDKLLLTTAKRPSCLILTRRPRIDTDL